MANVELVIKIPEDVYKDIMAHNRESRESGKSAYYFEGLIQNGIPLTKRHGRLKDFDKIEWYGCDFEGKACEKANGDCSVCNFGNCNAKQVRDLPTIIEADKENEE